MASLEDVYPKWKEKSKERKEINALNCPKCYNKAVKMTRNMKSMPNWTEYELFDYECEYRHKWRFVKGIKMLVNDKGEYSSIYYQ